MLCIGGGIAATHRLSLFSLFFCSSFFSPVLSLNLTRIGHLFWFFKILFAPGFLSLSLARSLARSLVHSLLLFRTVYLVYCPHPPSSCRMKYSNVTVLFSHAFMHLFCCHVVTDPKSNTVHLDTLQQPWNFRNFWKLEWDWDHVETHFPCHNYTWDVYCSSQEWQCNNKRGKKSAWCAAPHMAKKKKEREKKRKKNNKKKKKGWGRGEFRAFSTAHQSKFLCKIMPWLFARRGQTSAERGRETKNWSTKNSPIAIAPNIEKLLPSICWARRFRLHHASKPSCCQQANVGDLCGVTTRLSVFTSPDLTPCRQCNTSYSVRSSGVVQKIPTLACKGYRKSSNTSTCHQRP